MLYLPLFLGLVPCVSSLVANIYRNATYRKAVFVKRFEDSKLNAQPIETFLGLDYKQCVRKCLRNGDCKSFNLQLEAPLTCELLEKFVFDGGNHEYYKSGWNHYDPGPLLLPCLARLYNMPESEYYNPYMGKGDVGGRLSSENVDQLCDMQTDGGTLKHSFDALFALPYFLQ